MTIGASGSASDRRHAMAAFAKAYPNDPVDVIISDYMSEANMVVDVSDITLLKVMLLIETGGKESQLVQEGRHPRRLPHARGTCVRDSFH